MSHVLSFMHVSSVMPRMVVARANFTREFLFVTAMLAQTCYTNDFQSCYGSNSTTLLQPCWQTCYDTKLTGLLRLDSNNLVPNCYRPCYNLVGHNVVTALFRRLVSTLSTTCYRLVRATSQQPVRTQLDIGLTEQHCNNTVAGLLQTVRFYACSRNILQFCSLQKEW